MVDLGEFGEANPNTPIAFAVPILKFGFASLFHWAFGA
jgi:hypothetical protein